MSRPRKRTPDELETRLGERRRAVEQHIDELRRRLGDELGTLAPKGRGWVVPLVGFAAGLALAVALRSRGSRRR